MLFKKYTESIILFSIIELALISFYLIDKYIDPIRLTITIIIVAIIFATWLFIDIRKNRE